MQKPRYSNIQTIDEWPKFNGFAIFDLYIFAVHSAWAEC